MEIAVVEVFAVVVAVVIAVVVEVAMVVAVAVVFAIVVVFVAVVVVVADATLGEFAVIAVVVAAAVVAVVALQLGLFSSVLLTAATFFAFSGLSDSRDLFVFLVLLSSRMATARSTDNLATTPQGRHFNN